MNIKNIKIGALGCSRIAKKSLIPAIVDSENFILSGVSSRDEETAYKFSKEFETDDYSHEGLLDSDADAIYVSFPVGLHHEWGKKVLESGKHLLMEKTFTETYEQGKELFDIAEQNNLVCMEALMYEFNPLHSQIDNLLATKGDIKCVEAYFGIPHFEDKNDIRYLKELGGGAILDTLIYPLSFIFRILGNDFADFKSSIFYDKKSGVDERGYIHFEYDNAVANISYGLGHSYRNEVCIWTDKGMLKAERVFSRPKECTNPIEFWSNGKCKIYESELSNHFINMLDSFANYIDWGACPTHQNTLNRLKFIDRLRG